MEFLPSHSRRKAARSRASFRHSYDVVRMDSGAAAVSQIPGVASPDATAISRMFFTLSADLLCVLGYPVSSLKNSPDARITAPEPLICHLNPAWNQLLGNEGALRAAGRPLLDLTHPGDHDAVMLAFNGQLGASISAPIRFVARFSDGGRVNVADDWRWLDWTVSAADSNGHLYAVARDVTKTREADAAILFQATHDPLTGLPNRTLLHDRLSQALASASRQANGLAVLFLDLDRFKPINDSLGHAAGDILLKEVADRMRNTLRVEDTVARLGGDEFVVVLPRVTGGAHDAMEVAQKLLHQIAKPVSLLGHELYITASVGISFYPQDGQTCDTLIRNADHAMYRAKSEGLGKAMLHSDAGSDEALERLVMQSRLRQAVDRREMRLLYQPQVNLFSGEVFGVEALMRWHPKEMPMISPSKFIPLAEESGLIVSIGDWAVGEACRQAADWRRTGCPLRISVNLSAGQLIDDSFPDQLQRHLDEIGLPGPCVDLELTESTFIRSDSGVLDTLHRLKDMGVGLSVDDFGTGYSSLAYLRRFPIDGVKVDRSFIANLESSPADEAVVRAVIDLSHTLGLKVVAEGVETEAQMDCLRQLGCDAMQGYYFSEAIPPRDIPGLVAGGGSTSPMPPALAMAR